jgi:hypothetical protein
MKLSPLEIALERAYNDILLDINLARQRQAYSFNFIRRRPHHILPREQPFPTIPVPMPEFDPINPISSAQAKEKIIQLAAFEATYHDNLTPMTPDMVPLIFDTGASISLSPYKSDFIGPIHPTQNVTIKGIAAGLKVCGVGDLSYTFLNDDGEEQQHILRNCLYVPDCVDRLICPRQIGAETQHPSDGLNATHAHTILTVNSKPTTIRYDTTSQLPVLYTKPGIATYLAFKTLLEKSYATHDTTDNPLSAPLPAKLNLTARQHQKLYLHEICAHEGFQNLNTWIRRGCFPGVTSSLASEPDPICASCVFGKARKKCHNSHVGQITSGHTKPGQGVSSDGLESGTPGRPFTTKGSPSKIRYNYVSFRVDHHSALVYVTFHSSKAASKLVASKTEFEHFAARFNVRIESIRADNGIYSAKLFREACSKQQQDLTFCAVGAHWQNGAAERFIGTITQRALTILLHAMSK